jgi:thioredoxin-dependent peroxiredoxin
VAKTQVAIGKKVPKFTAPASDGTAWSAADALGKKLVVYFYPRDNTPGCTLEGQAFRDLYAQFKKARVEIVGVSADSVESHSKFKAKMEFPFELLADEKKAVCALFDVYREKTLYGRKFMGIERSTFLIDSKGVLQQEWRKVKVKDHAEQVLAAAKALD